MLVEENVGMLRPFPVGAEGDQELWRSRLLSRGLVEPERLRRAYDEIEALLYRFPAVDPPSFRARVDEAARGG